MKPLTIVSGEPLVRWTADRALGFGFSGTTYHLEYSELPDQTVVWYKAVSPHGIVIAEHCEKLSEHDMSDMLHRGLMKDAEVREAIRLVLCGKANLLPPAAKTLADFDMQEWRPLPSTWSPSFH